MVSIKLGMGPRLLVIYYLYEPTNYKEMITLPEAAKWKGTMDSEIISMQDNQVWTLVDHTPSQKTLVCKWDFKKKNNIYGNVQRLLTKGFTQPQGVDYDETFSLVSKIMSIRVMLTITAFHDYEVQQIDVKSPSLTGS